MYHVHDVQRGQWSAYCLIGVAQIWICCSPIYNRENVPGILYERNYLSVLYISYGSPGMIYAAFFKISLIVVILFG